MASDGLMRAIVVPQHGEPAVLVERALPAPTPAPGRVLVRVASAGVNFSDVLTIAGRYPGPPPPFVPGIEVAGLTADARPVIALLESGGYAEVASADERMVFSADGIDVERAGGYGLVTLAAYFGLRRAARLEPGETVMVLAAAGGLGIAAMQVARALGAGRVIAVASTPEKLSLALTLGADEAVLYGDDLPAADLVVDGVGGLAFAQAYRATRRLGRVLIVGASSGEPPPLPAFQELRERGVGLVPFSFKALREHAPDLVAREAPAALDLIRRGEVRPHVADAMPLADAPLALSRLAARETVGKLLLRP
jgi:NADPH:quinone reductase